LCAISLNLVPKSRRKVELRRAVTAGYWTADGLLRSEALEMDRLRSQIRDRKIPVQGPFGIELRRKCGKNEYFEGKETEALPQSFYCNPS